MSEKKQILRALVLIHRAADYRLWRLFGTAKIAAIRGMAADDRRRFQGELHRRLGLPPIRR